MVINFLVIIILIISKLNPNDVGFPVEASTKGVIVMIVIIPITITTYRR